MAISIPDLEQVEAWKSSPMISRVGWHDVTIVEAEEGKSGNDNPEFQLQFSGDEGSIRDWVQVTEATLGKIKSLVQAVGLEFSGGDLAAEKFRNRRLSIFVGTEPDRDDPTKERHRVKGYRARSDLPADTTGFESNGSDTGDDIPF